MYSRRLDAPVILSEKEAELLIALSQQINQSQVILRPYLSNLISALTNDESVSVPSEIEASKVESSEQPERTTLMIRRVPRRYSLDDFSQIIDLLPGIKGNYDLLYLPVDLERSSNRG